MEDVPKLYTVYKTVVAMLLARNYIPSSETATNFEEFKTIFAGQPREKLSILGPKKDNPTDSIFVFFCDEMRVGCKQVPLCS